MAAPDLTQRTTVFVAKIGTDDPGYNVVGAPQPRLTIATALVDLLVGYNAATATAPKTISLEPGTYTTPAFALPANVFIEADPDAEGGSNGEVVILLTGNITLDSSWAANATAIGGFRGVKIIQNTSQHVDFTMPSPTGSPSRRVTLEDCRINVDQVIFEATGANDQIRVNDVILDGTTSQTAHFSGGSQLINNLEFAGPITCDDTGAIAPVIQAYGLFGTTASSSLTFLSSATGLTARLADSSIRALTISQSGAGALALTADAVSLPVRANITYSGTATAAANLTLINDAAGDGYTPTTPGNWSPVPTTVQSALDTLAVTAGGGGGGITTSYLLRTGNRSSAAWGTAGVAINDTVNTFTDSTSVGAVAGVTAARSFAIPTFASAGGVTYATAVNVYIAGAPTITGGTATAAWALYVAAGNSFFGGNVATNTVTSAAGSSLTLQTADTNQNILLSPNGTGATLITGTRNLQFGAAAVVTLGISADTLSGVTSLNLAHNNGVTDSTQIFKVIANYTRYFYMTGAGNAGLSSGSFQADAGNFVIGTTGALGLFNSKVWLAAAYGSGDVGFDRTGAGTAKISGGNGGGFGQLTTGNLIVNSGSTFQLGNARAAGVLVQAGSVTMLDSTGATITVLTT